MQIVSRRFLLYFKNSNNKTNLILNCDLRPGNCLLNACGYLNFVVKVISANAKKNCHILVCQRKQLVISDISIGFG